MNKQQKHLFALEKAKAKKHGIKFDLVDDIYIKKDSIKYFGYFDEDSLAVAVKGKVNRWFPIFVHETCHMDQFIENDPCWNKRVNKKYCPLMLYDMYLDRCINLESKKTEMDIQKYCVEVELDCEKRSVQKIKEFDLGIDTDEYIKKANLYIFLYPFFFQERKKWTSNKKIERNNPNIWNVIPNYFLKSPMDYVNIPDEILIELKKGIKTNEETTNVEPDFSGSDISGSGVGT